MRKGLLIAALHVGLVASLGAKLLLDRATRPRVWARAAPVDPSLPIRGRYVSLRVEAGLAEPPGTSGASSAEPALGTFQASIPVTLTVRDGRLVATPAAVGARLTARPTSRNGERIAVLNEPLAYFIPEHISDPSRRSPGEELWVEVTLPRAGAPRPIQLGVKKDGVLSPLGMTP